MLSQMKPLLACIMPIAIVLLFNVPGISQTTSSPESIRSFVQGFYDWYVPLAYSDLSGPASDIVLNERPYVLSPQLLKALQEDSDAQGKVSGIIVGLDWDPFLNGQDPFERYQVGRIFKKGSTYRIEIFGYQSGKKLSTPSVIAEVYQRNGKCYFVNFHWPGGGDLLHSLKLLKKARHENNEP